MEVAYKLPPMIDEIDAVFHVRNEPVLFAWGHTIYNPRGIDIPPCLFAHESVHCERQGRDIEGWWKRYLADPAFRLDEELPAHRAELRSLIDSSATRAERRFYMRRVARRLAAPLYGSLITPGRALELLKAA